VRYLDDKQDKKLQLSMLILSGIFHRITPTEKTMPEYTKLAWQAAGELWDLAAKECEKERPNTGIGSAP
jgi:hypothetical protein